MTRALICLAFGFASVGCGGGDDKVKLPDRTYKAPAGDYDPNAKNAKEAGTNEQEK